MKRKKRNIAAEIMEGIEAMRLHREGKITLRTHVVTIKPLPKVRLT